MVWDYLVAFLRMVLSIPVAYCAITHLDDNSIVLMCEWPNDMINSVPLHLLIKRTNVWNKTKAILF